MISPREMRLLFWLIVIALVGVIGVLGSGIAETLSGPAVILFIAWLMAYVLEPRGDLADASSAVPFARPGRDRYLPARRSR